MSRPDVSVVIPTRDRAGLLPMAIGSALAQRGVAVEVIVVDDASTDATCELVRSVADSRVRSVRQSHPQGVAVARNAGLALASGEWVAFLDDDDLWAPTKLARQLEALGRSKAVWSCCGAVVVDAGLRPLRVQRALPEVVEHLGRWNAVPGGGSGVVARRSVLNSLEGFDPALAILADWDMWLRLAAAAPMVSVAAPLVAYRLHDGSLTHRLRGIRRELAVVRERHGIVPDRQRWRLWLADMHQRAGRRGRAALSYVGAAGSLLPFVQAVRRAGGAVVHGRAAVVRRDAAEAAALDPWMRRAVAAWAVAAWDAGARALRPERVGLSGPVPLRTE